jgi:hypothetical protein
MLWLSVGVYLKMDAFKKDLETVKQAHKQFASTSDIAGSFAVYMSHV